MKTKVVEITPAVAFELWQKCQKFYIGTKHEPTRFIMQRDPRNAVQTEDAPFLSYAASAARDLGVSRKKIKFFEKRHVRSVGERVMDSIMLSGGHIAGRLFRFPV